MSSRRPVWTAATKAYMEWWLHKVREWQSGRSDVEPHRMGSDRAFVSGFRAGVRFQQRREKERQS